MASSLPEVHLEGLKKLFQSIDKDGSGSISVDEMRKSLKQKGANVGQSEVSFSMKDVSIGVYQSQIECIMFHHVSHDISVALCVGDAPSGKP